MEPRVITVKYLGFNEWKRGPGGHWLKYEASDGKNVAYGQTELEARKTLATQNEAP